MVSSWLFSLWLFLAADLFPRGLAPIDAGAPAKLRAAACVGCHPAVHDEWAQSRHGLAWTNAIFQREYRDRPLDWCVHCHAPLVEQLAEVKRGGGSLADEGVNCAVCHIREGRMLSRRRSAASPHDTDARPDFGGTAYCAGCHQFTFPTIEPDPSGKGPGRVTGYTAHPMQDTAAQHARGPHADKECLSCHQRETGAHRFPGGHDAEMIAGALQIETCRQRGALVVSLANTGAGHNVPTGDLHRHLVLRAWRASTPETLQEITLGRRFAPAPDGGKRTIADTTIRAGETRRLELPLGKLAAPSPAALARRARVRPPEKTIVAHRAFGAERLEPISLELRLVYTIDEFPFKGRELAAPTFATMFARDLDWKTIARCGRRP